MLQVHFESRAFRRLIPAMTIAVLLSASAQAEVSLVADPTLPTPAESALYTVDVFSVTNANRGIATNAATGHRHLRQTFKLANATTIGNIIFGLNVGDVNAGLQLRIYEVADVQSAWSPGAVVKEMIFPTVIDTTNWLQVSLTDTDVFTLPARSAGTTGYGIEFADNQGVNGTTLGLLHMTNDGTNDYYLDGRYYSESAGFATRDIGLIIVGTQTAPCDPGDVNCMGGVTIEDLEIIAANFRKAGSREMGDLTGNGFVDFDDFGQWKQFYMGPGLGAEAFAFLTVPEPGSLILLVSGLAGVLFRARRRHPPHYPS